MTEIDVVTRTREYITENFLYMRPDFVLGDDDALLATRVIDSLGVMEVIEFIEREFGVKVQPWEITEENLGSLTQIGRMVVTKAGASRAA